MAAIDDILAFEDGSSAMVFDLTETQVGAVLLHQTDALTSGSKVWLTGKPLSCWWDSLLGRVVDPQGIPVGMGRALPTHLPRPSSPISNWRCPLPIGINVSMIFIPV